MTTISTLGGDIVIEHPAAGIAVMRMPHEFDEYTSPSVRTASLELVRAGAHTIVADLGPVEFITSMGLGVLVGMLKRARAHGGTVVLADLDERVSKAFRVSGLLTYFEIRESVDTALAELQGSRALLKEGA